jgi:hypothetical protein
MKIPDAEAQLGTADYSNINKLERRPLKAKQISGPLFIWSTISKQVSFSGME